MSDKHRTVFIVHRRIQFQLGDCVIQAVAAFDSEDEAKKAAQLRDGALRDVLGFRMVNPEDGKTEGQCKEILASIGAMGIGHTVMKVQVKEKNAIISPGGENVVPLSVRKSIVNP